MKEGHGDTRAIKIDVKREIYIYFILDRESNAVKIGRSNDIDDRLKDLQVGNPHRLVVIHAEIGNVPTETMLHKKFKKHRLVGEWFKYSDKIIKYISDYPYRGGREEEQGEYTEEFEEEMKDEFCGGIRSFAGGNTDIGAAEESPWLHNAVKALEDWEVIKINIKGEIK